MCGPQGVLCGVPVVCGTSSHIARSPGRVWTQGGVSWHLSSVWHPRMRCVESVTCGDPGSCSVTSHCVWGPYGVARLAAGLLRSHPARRSAGLRLWRGTMWVSGPRRWRRRRRRDDSPPSHAGSGLGRKRGGPGAAAAAPAERPSGGRGRAEPSAADSRVGGAERRRAGPSRGRADPSPGRPGPNSGRTGPNPRRTGPSAAERGRGERAFLEEPAGRRTHSWPALG